MDALRRKVRQSGAYALARRAGLEARMIKAPDRVLPNFLMIGTHKGGTSSFYGNLCNHPQVFPALTKEVHFFDRDPQASERWYRAHFPSQKELAAVDGITGEATPAYSVLPQVPERVKTCVPNAKIMMMLRDPVSRAYSTYQFDKRRGGPDATFAQWVDKSMKRIGDRHLDLDAFRDLIGNDLSKITMPMGILRGIYVTQIKNWHSFFPKEQISIFDSGDYFSDPPAFLNKVATETFGLKPHTFEYQKAYHEKRGYDKIDEETKARLDVFFKPYNEALYEYLGRDFGW